MANRRTNARLVKEIVILCVLAILIGGFTLLKFGKPATQPAAAPAPRMQTDFDVETAEIVDQKNTSFPAITSDGVGKSDPFAP